MYLFKPVPSVVCCSLLLSAGLVLSFPGAWHADGNPPEKALVSDLSGVLSDANRPAPEEPDAFAGTSQEHRFIYRPVVWNQTFFNSSLEQRRLYKAYLLKRPPPA